MTNVIVVNKKMLTGGIIVEEIMKMVCEPNRNRLKLIESKLSIFISNYLN